MPCSVRLHALVVCGMAFSPLHQACFLVPFCGEGEWKQQCWKKREERKWEVDMQWVKWSRGWRKGQVQVASLHRAKIQVSMYQAVLVSEHLKFHNFCDCYYQLVFWQFRLPTPPQGQMERRIFLDLMVLVYFEGVCQMCRKDCGFIQALALFQCKVFTISAFGNWSCWHIALFFPLSSFCCLSFMLTSL